MASNSKEPRPEQSSMGEFSAAARMCECGHVFGRHRGVGVGDAAEVCRDCNCEGFHAASPLPAEPPPTNGQNGVCDCASGRHFEGNKHYAAPTVCPSCGASYQRYDHTPCHDKWHDATPSAAEPQKELHKLDGEMFWDASDTEKFAENDPDELLDDCDDRAIVRIQQAKRMPDIFGFAVTKDDGEREFRYFNTKQEAEAAAEPQKEE